VGVGEEGEEESDNVGEGGRRVRVGERGGRVGGGGRWEVGEVNRGVG